MKSISNLFLIILFLYVNAYAQEQVELKHSQLKIDCKTCHSCEVPTKDDPCLIACPRFKMIKTYPPAETSPDVFVIDKLVDRYDPVVFSHRLHAQMSVISGGCETCHHYNTLGPILSCNECHSTERKREDVRTPDLKGAYHQQCLNCHRQWSRQTECVSCHQPREAGKEFNVEEKISEFTNKFHPKVIEPDKIVFETDYSKGKLVTFYHDEHTELFGIGCTNCHKEENCIRCHDVKNTVNNELTFYKNPVKLNMPEGERHKRCSSCHEEKNCTFCHKESITQPFDHVRRSGWALSKFHKELACRDCHGNENRFTKLETNCISCHSGWASENFDHKVTGLVLDETHIQIDCVDCHTNRDFEKTPVCIECHDDKTFPENLPGKLIK